MLRIAAGSEVTITCGSITVGVIQGEAEVILGGGLAVVSIPAGGATRITDNPDGSFAVENLGEGDLSVNVDGTETTIGSGDSRGIEAWDFQGFAAPVDNPDVMNIAKAGQAVPLRWRLVGADGQPVVGLSTAKVTVSSLPCSQGMTPDLLEEGASGSSGIQDLGNGNYQFNWKAPKSYARSCKVMRLDVGDGVTHDALFEFRK